jgi:hypothetical protein
MIAMSKDTREKARRAMKQEISFNYDTYTAHCCEALADRYNSRVITLLFHEGDNLPFDLQALHDFLEGALAERRVIKVGKTDEKYASDCRVYSLRMDSAGSIEVIISRVGSPKPRKW